jgi:4-hydroxy-3-methylbut-2-enyl diphosphate reductase
MMEVVIDPDAGFCFGVEKAIHAAEISLQEEQDLYCLGEIVHNELETGRLKSLGLKVIDHETYRHLKNVTVLIRAHGEPPQTYIHAKENNIHLIEATCPVVLKLQQKIHFSHLQVKDKGQVVIAGKKMHPEVISLVGQTNGAAIVIESTDDIEKIDFTKSIELFSQTTLSGEKFDEILNAINRRLEYAGANAKLQVHRTICGQVSHRVPKLRLFCKKHDVILFVSGKNSSNGKALFEVCKKTNPRSYHISAPDELEKEWIHGAETTGISGATSTPPWLMKEVASKTKELSCT